MPHSAGERRAYTDRREAGAALAARLAHLKGRDDVVVLALPRGGVPVGYEVACSIDAPLDVFMFRKLGLPGHPELAMGALATGGVRVLNDDIVSWYRIPSSTIDFVAREEQTELDRREHAYRGRRPPVEVRDRIAVIVDDGLATGSTMRAAVQALRTQRPSRIVVAVPVGAPESCRELADVAEEVVCAWEPDEFAAVGEWYQDFTQTTDDEVRALLGAADGVASREH
jgi:predicted phosphoribosyltransferase